jgi:hypothetical protein
MGKTASAALASLTMMIGCVHAGELGQDDESRLKLPPGFIVRVAVLDCQLCSGK